MFTVNNKGTSMTPLTSFSVFILNLEQFSHLILAETGEITNKASQNKSFSPI